MAKPPPAKRARSPKDSRAPKRSKSSASKSAKVPQEEEEPMSYDDLYGSDQDMQESDLDLQVTESEQEGSEDHDDLALLPATLEPVKAPVVPLSQEPVVQTAQVPPCF